MIVVGGKFQIKANSGLLTFGDRPFGLPVYEIWRGILHVGLFFEGDGLRS